MFALFASSCNREKLAQLEKDVQTLRAEKHVADSLQDAFYAYLNEVESNLNTIKGKEQIISETREGQPTSVQEKILQDLAEINDLMEKNRKSLRELEGLRSKLREANVNTSRLEEMVKALQVRVSEQEAQIQKLQAELKIANEKIAELSAQNKQIQEENERKQKTIEEQIKTLNTAYYVLGTSQQLKETGVINTKGGFIGIGKATVISKTADPSQFKRIDVRETKVIETNSARIDIISPHTEGAYTIDSSDPNNLKIEIKDATAFWKQSKYLVVKVR
ncbi:hypothetical protein FACS1894201_02000 [Bacteroidia bacterium]|nr:hypothetical protein FACS1894201_02000 [Bacteroidia bacterium]